MAIAGVLQISRQIAGALAAAHCMAASLRPSSPAVRSATERGVDMVCRRVSRICSSTRPEPRCNHTCGTSGPDPWHVKPIQ